MEKNQEGGGKGDKGRGRRRWRKIKREEGRRKTKREMQGG